MEKTILVDTGPDAGILRALGLALPMWQRSIDAVILTGTKTSFVGGLPEVQDRYRVSKNYAYWQHHHSLRHASPVRQRSY